MISSEREGRLSGSDSRVGRLRGALLSKISVAALCAAIPVSALAQPESKPTAIGAAWGDQGDGTYVNPVIPGDFSDLDAIRVGVFSYNNQSDSGFVEVDWFHYGFATPTGTAESGQ